MATPHNAAKKGDIAPFVLMPGDPLRARWISETYLQNPICFNSVRGMLGYTGLYHGKRVSVMGSGMGCPAWAYMRMSSSMNTKWKRSSALVLPGLYSLIYRCAVW